MYDAAAQDELVIGGGSACCPGRAWWPPTSSALAGRSPASARRGPTPAPTSMRAAASFSRHRRHSWRCLRTPDHAAAEDHVPARHRAPRERPAACRQRHHHRLSRHHRVMGAGPEEPGASAEDHCRTRQPGTAIPGRASHPHRWETFALDEMADVQALFARRKKPLLAFNDHTDQRLPVRGSITRCRVQPSAR